MKTQKLKSALFLFLVTTTSSFAQDAASVQSALQTYVGAETGVVTVTQAGDAFDIALDIAPYLKKVAQAGFTSKVDPFKFKATPNSDGTWAITSSGAWNMTAEVPQTFNMNYGVKNFDYTGVFSPALMGFLESKFDITGLTFNQTGNDPSTQLKSTAVSTVEKIIGSSKSTDLGNGTADGQSSFVFTGFSSSTKMEMPPEVAAAEGMPNLNYSWTSPSGKYDTSSKGLATKPLLELAAFFVAHPSQELLIKDQPILKEKLLAALPVFASVVGGYSFDNVVIDTGVGKFGLASAAIDVDMNGATKDGRLAETFSFQSLTLPDGLPLPPWSKGMIPKDVKIGFALSDFDLEAPVRKFVTEMDIAKPEPIPAGSEMAYMAAFAPKNSLTVTIPPSEIVADIYRITLEGVTVQNFAGLPTVNAKVSMKGMDAVITQLQSAAADPMAQQAMAGLFAAKGIGKADGEITTWDIVMGADGKVMVNGTDLSAMLGMAAPPAPAPAQ